MEDRSGAAALIAVILGITAIFVFGDIQDTKRKAIELEQKRIELQILMYSE